MEKNSDILVMNCYAQMFVNVRPGAGQWRPNRIGYDGLRIHGVPTHHAIEMFSTHISNQMREATGTGLRTLPPTGTTLTLAAR